MRNRELPEEWKVAIKAAYEAALAAQNWEDFNDVFKAYPEFVKLTRPLGYGLLKEEDLPNPPDGSVF
jgi:hypothetical protein